LVDTLAKIAAEKAGILKPGIPLVLAPQVDEARQSILKVAAARSVPVFEIGKDFHYGPITKSLTNQQLLVWSTADSEGDIPQLELSIPLLGEHQLVNATTAFAALMVAKGEGISVTLDGIMEGFQNVNWPGRFEILRDNPALIVDSAHNRDSAQKLYKVLQDYFPDRKVVLVFGASEDKDIRGMLSELKPAVKEIVMTRSSHPRAADPDQLVALAKELHCQAVATQSVEEAMQVAERLAKRKTMILVTGSIFVAAAARSVWMAGERG
jgi:dihydrofolate synthase/folylpolyglutamate synthase